MSYVVKIIGPAGRETFLWRGREVDEEEHATHYPHPSSARRAADAYSDKAKRIWPCPPFVGVYDPRDPERGWL